MVGNNNRWSELEIQWNRDNRVMTKQMRKILGGAPPDIQMNLIYSLFDSMFRNKLTTIFARHEMVKTCLCAYSFGLRGVGVGVRGTYLAR